MSFSDVFLAVIIIGLLLIAGKSIRDRVEVFRRLFIPSSVVAGCLGLLLGPGVLGKLSLLVLGDGNPLAGGIFPPGVLKVWQEIPGLLISVVFAGLFLGRRIPGIRDIWYKAGPQVAFGQAVAWGQYLVGTLCVLVLLGPVFGTNPAAAALIEIAYEGGHGTAAGLSSTFEVFGFPEGADLAMALATIGLVSGVAVGTILINWAARTGRITQEHPVEQAEEVIAGLGELEEVEPAPVDTAPPEVTIDGLTLNIGYVGLAVAIGWLILKGLILLEGLFLGKSGTGGLMQFVPLFPLAMIGGILMQMCLDRAGRTAMVDRHLVNHVSGTSLDLIIIAALSTISLAAIGENIWPFLILAVLGLAWNVGALIYIAPRVFPVYWFERAIGDFGQSTGMTVTGLLLMRICDPENRSGAIESFGYKQLLCEPFVGGGLVTAAAIPVIYRVGTFPVMLVALVLCIGWVLFGVFTFGSRRKKQFP